MGNECTVAALPNGKMMINMRKTRPERETYGPGRLAAVSEDDALSFNTPYYEKTLIEPVCQASLINASGKKPSKNLIFSNPEHPTSRENLTLRMSRDEGHSWRRVATLTEGPAAYSDLVLLGKGNVGVLYEAGKENPYEGIFFSRVGSKVIRKNWKREKTL